MKHTLRVTALGLALIGLLTLGSINNGLVGQGSDATKGSTDEELVTFILDDFEKSGAWTPAMPRDQGVIFSMRREGVPPLLKRINKLTRDISNQNEAYLRKKQAQKQQPKENPLTGFPYRDNKYVLGVRVEFMKRGYNWFTITPPQPIKIPGICKQISCWVVGRGYRHWLWIMIRDYHGRRRYLSAMRPLIHKGWRKILFPIRADQIVQEDYKVTDPKKVGITFDGFLVQCDPMESRGKYYIYFDLLTAQVDLYFEFNRDDDDMRDFW